MTAFQYDQSAYTIPAYKVEAHRKAWQYLSRPGSWWTAAERIAIAESSRAALACTLCEERKAALSPLAVRGRHDNPIVPLDDKVVDAAHRITTDSARISGSWVKSLIGESFGFGHYIEMVSVIVSLISIDTVHHALDIPLEPLPEPQAGEPDGYWPAGAAVDVAWVPMIQPENLTEKEADIYHGFPRTGHVIRALSLVPDAVRALSLLSEAHYLPMPQVMDFSMSGHLNLTRVQTELVASRTSRLNDCFY